MERRKKLYPSSLGGGFFLDKKIAYASVNAVSRETHGALAPRSPLKIKPCF